MATDRFDALAKAMISSCGRRRLLAGLTGASITCGLGRTGDAAAADLCIAANGNKMISGSSGGATGRKKKRWTSP